MKSFLFATLLYGASALAGTTTYDVKGMHCGACAKSIQAEVCSLDGIEKCEVTVGKILITSKPGVEVSQAQVQSKMDEAGEYTITGSNKK